MQVSNSTTVALPHMVIAGFKTIGANTEDCDHTASMLARAKSSHLLPVPQIRRVNRDNLGIISDNST